MASSVTTVRRIRTGVGRDMGLIAPPPNPLWIPMVSKLALPGSTADGEAPDLLILTLGRLQDEERRILGVRAFPDDSPTIGQQGAKTGRAILGIMPLVAIRAEVKIRADNHHPLAECYRLSRAN
jgi:hypothetical protein